MNKIKDFLIANNLDFHNLDTIETAFTHRSYLNENKTKSNKHNERLEFLGDAVLELIVTQYLYNTYPNPEGELTNWRGAIVKGEKLAAVAKRLGIGELIKLSKGEEKGGGKARNLLLANALEALIGAIFIDQGYDKARDFISLNLFGELNKIIQEGSFIDSKSKLQEQVQADSNVTPIYKVLDESGPDHNKTFEVGVFIKDKMVGKGSGESKRKAEQEAAKDGLNYLNKG